MTHSRTSSLFVVPSHATFQTIPQFHMFGSETIMSKIFDPGFKSVYSSQVPIVLFIVLLVHVLTYLLTYLQIFSLPGGRVGRIKARQKLRPHNLSRWIMHWQADPSTAPSRSTDARNFSNCKNKNKSYRGCRDLTGSNSERSSMGSRGTTGSRRRKRGSLHGQ